MAQGFVPEAATSHGVLKDTFRHFLATSKPRGRPSAFTSAKEESRLAMLAGNFSVWSTVSSLMVRC